MQHYDVDVTDPAEVDVDRFYLRYSRRSPQQAQRWLDGLTAALASLSSLPSRCSLARENERHDGMVLRQLLYRFGSATYRIVFRVIEPEPGSDGRGAVRVMYLRDARQQVFGAVGDEEENEA